MNKKRTQIFIVDIKSLPEELCLEPPLDDMAVSEPGRRPWGGNSRISGCFSFIMGPPGGKP